MQTTHDTSQKVETAILVGLEDDRDLIPIDASLDELEELAATAGASAVGRLTQKRDRPDVRTFLGSGKLLELKDLANLTDADTIIFDSELSPAQLRNLSKEFDQKIIDRTLLILDIFAMRANSAEGKVQVELAQLKYRLSHLSGLGKALSRLGGGIGTRGPGETKLETDRREIRDRLSGLNRELKEIQERRAVLREKRERTGIPVASMVGYTNAGKSTILNLLTSAGVLAEDKLFATLDTTTRKIELPGGADILYTDTVGFIQKLPHQLVQAFRATLEELTRADILVHVVDASNPSREEQMRVVYDTIKELKCFDKPVITVFNKIDRAVELPLPADPHAVKVAKLSALTGQGQEDFLQALEDVVKSFKSSLHVLVPYTEGHLIGLIHKSCDIIEEEHTDTGVRFVLYANEEMSNRLNPFCIE